MMKRWLKRIFDKKEHRPHARQRRKLSVQLRLEELENRLVPSATVQFSAAAETVNAAAGTFSIPVTLTGTPPPPTITTFATFANSIQQIAFDPAGNLYVAGLYTVQEVTPAGVVSTLASGFFGAGGLAFNAGQRLRHRRQNSG